MAVARLNLCRVIAQAVSRWLPTAAAQVSDQVVWDLWWTKWLGQVFSTYFSFPCQFSFHQLLHTHHLSSGASTIDQIVADVSSGLSLTPPQETKQNN
jgi:integral membrane sensor domain MASE1